MGVTVRTLQYYDKEGLLKLASMSEGAEGFIVQGTWKSFIKF